MSTTIYEVELSHLSLGIIPALTPAMGGVLEEACVLELEEHGGHHSGVSLTVMGDSQTTVSIAWKLTVSETMRRCYAEQKDCTEWAACGLALLLLKQLTNFTAIERSYIGTGFDYWLGSLEDVDKNIFVNKARLEVSGIRRGSDADLKSRVQQKLRQIREAPLNQLPAYISVTEFGQPISNLVEKK